MAVSKARVLVIMVAPPAFDYLTALSAQSFFTLERIAEL
jgi:hypothetical protein